MTEFYLLNILEAGHSYFETNRASPGGQIAWLLLLMIGVVHCRIPKYHLNRISFHRKPFWTYLNLSEPNWTYPTLSESIKTYPNLSELIWTYPNLSKPIQTYPNLIQKLQSFSLDKIMSNHLLFIWWYVGDWKLSMVEWMIMAERTGTKISFASWAHNQLVLGSGQLDTLYYLIEDDPHLSFLKIYILSQSLFIKR